QLLKLELTQLIPLLLPWLGRPLKYRCQPWLRRLTIQNERPDSTYNMLPVWNRTGRQYARYTHHLSQVYPPLPDVFTPMRYPVGSCRTYVSRPLHWVLANASNRSKICMRPPMIFSAIS